MNPVCRFAVAAAVLITAVPTLAAQSASQPTTAPQAPTQPPSLIVEKIIVKVNGEILTQTELERIQIETLQQDQNRRIASPRDLVTDAGLIKALTDITPSILSDKIDELLIVQFGREMGVKFTDENFRLTIQNVKQQNKLNDQQFAEAMKESGITLELLRERFEREYIRRQVEQREIMKNMTLTEEEARQYYKAHPDEFMKPPTVTLREILVTVPTETTGGQTTINVAKDEAARDRISAIRERALKGEDFVKLVEEASEAGSKANGGIVGPVVTTDVSPAVGAAIEKLKPGEVTEVLRLGNGYRIFKLESRTAAEVEAFDKLRNQIAQHIYDARLGTETEKFLSKLRTQALIEWKDETYKKMFETTQAKKAKTGL
jgi:peptidyl-prolyl cis-trans isomerase SurA